MNWNKLPTKKRCGEEGREEEGTLAMARNVRSSSENTCAAMYSWEDLTHRSTCDCVGGGRSAPARQKYSRGALHQDACP